ncbi:curculin (mannose-binding) lectin protein [Pseudaeromonas paramecii]|uniref:Tip attachment protein J domain-containing protein n=1 Tax=Pseudaeromonas paramecii TaxID=2138166 RepID=A0ABP8PY92_9GAMM
MPILQGDIKLLASQVMADTDDGGGAMTNTEIVDGEHNAMFPDISDLDRAYGRVNLRKAFMAVQTDDTEVYYGSHIIVKKPPTDPNVAITLFSTDDPFDVRADAQDRMESYLARGPRWQGFLYDTQIKGQRALRFFQRQAVRLPEVGEVLVLIGDEGKATEFEQYVRITGVAAVDTKFLVSGYSQEFVRTVVTAEIADPLRYTFEGQSPTPFDDAKQATGFRETVVADAAQYYGTVRLAKDADFGSLQVQAETIFTQLVPSSRTETPAIDLTAGGKSSTLSPSDNGTVAISTTVAIAAGKAFYLGTGCQPGSLAIVIGAATISDKGGALLLAGTQVGTIDYAAGTLSFTSQCPDYGTASKAISFKPASAIIRVSDTQAIEVNENTRGYAYVGTLLPIPAPGSLTFSYMAQGKWYELTDNGRGELYGADSAYGSGTLNYTTGSYMVTLGALPDTGSHILLAWGAPTTSFNRANVASSALKIRACLGDALYPDTRNGGQAYLGNIAAGTWTATWDENGTERTATADAAGVVSGDATGSLDHRTGDLVLIPNKLPSVGTTVAMSWQRNGERTELALDDLGLMVAGQQVTGTLPNAPTIPGRTLLRLPLQLTDEVEAVNPLVYVTLYDTPAGQLINQADGSVLGSLDAATGAFSIEAPSTAKFLVRQYERRRDPANNYLYAWMVTSTGWSVQHCAPAAEGLAWARTQYSDASSTVSAEQTLSALSWDFVPSAGEQVAIGSVRFAFGGSTYIDRQGLLYKDVDPATNSGTQAGSFDYANGVAKVTQWTVGQANGDVVLQSLLTYLDEHTVSSVAFRTPGAPLRPGSLYVQCLDTDGNLHSFTASADGVINTGIFDGSVDHDTGVVKLHFGSLVVADENTQAEWYDQDLVDANGYIWRSKQIRADSIRFNCVTYSYLPLDADIIKLDPVRLPSDGRVPILRKGNVVVIHSTRRTEFPNPVSAGYQLDLNRERISRLSLEDATGTQLDGALWQADLDYGIVTLASPLDLSGYTQPITVVHEVEDMSLITDVEISGKLTLSKALSHDYAAADTYVSSALIIDDMWARANNVFDQTTWTGAWSNTLIGSQTNAQFNATDYPITVTNRGAITERWALVFTSTTTFKIIGEHLGQIGTGNINEICAPLRPAVNVPYWSINPLAFGAGWSDGNVVRFNTIGANAPFQTARTILQSDAAIDDDEFALQLRGNINKE